MPFVDISGNGVNKGVAVTDERTVTLSGGEDTFDVDMTGLVSVSEVVDVSYNGEEVNESENLTAEVNDPASDISGNTVTVTFYSGDDTNTDEISALTSSATTTSADDEVTVTAEGY